MVSSKSLLHDDLCRIKFQIKNRDIAKDYNLFSKILFFGRSRLTYTYFVILCSDH